MFIYGGYDSKKGYLSPHLYEVFLDEINNNKVKFKKVIIKDKVQPIARGLTGACLFKN